MRLSFYFDTYPGMDPKFVYASTNPSSKIDGWKRYRFDVTIPDPNEPDEIAIAKAEADHADRS